MTTLVAHTDGGHNGPVRNVTTPCLVLRRLSRNMSPSVHRST